MTKHLHIVALDVPYPVDYGGVFDLFYKIKSLKQKGISINLHCFDSGRGPQPELNKYCSEVHYYPRHQGHQGFSFKNPYIVCSRRHPHLLDNLKKNDAPILLEGIHCTYNLHQGYLEGRKVFLRLHNVEYEYYRQLANCEKSLYKKMYFLNESRLLKKYEKEIATKVPVISVCAKDAKTYRETFHCKNASHIPVFIPCTLPIAKEGFGSFCLYQGNLSVPENEKAATWLLKHVFNDLKIPLVIAGKNPSKSLQKLSHIHQHTCIVANPSVKDINELISKAHINILPSFTTSGIKLKLINALYYGRHCLANNNMVSGTGLENACHIADTADGFKSILAQIYHQPYHEEDRQVRIGVLQQNFSNEQNAEKLIQMIW